MCERNAEVLINSDALLQAARGAVTTRLVIVLGAAAGVVGVRDLNGAVFLHKLMTVQSRGNRTRTVGWTQSSAMLVRRRAAEDVGWLDPEFFVYSDETDFCKRLGDVGWRILWVPAARAIHHDQLKRDVGLRKYACDRTRQQRHAIVGWQHNGNVGSLHHVPPAAPARPLQYKYDTCIIFCI